jgi:hypothetical protein
MKKTLQTIFTFVILLMTAQLALTYSNSAPPAAHTNAPGEANCTACHTSFPLTVAGPFWDSVQLTSTVPLNQFEPATTYTMSLTFSNLASSKYGFEMVALPSGADPSTASIGTFVSTDAETEVNVDNVREYISHSNVGTAVTANTKTWTFEWTTDPSYVGDVDFYVVVNCTNNSSTNVGDRIIAKVFSSSVLPVKWLSYEVKDEKAGNHLKWSTASESNNLQFEVEKSADGILWKQLSIVKAKGNSNQRTDYDYMDPLKTAAKTYYRIKQVDMDGRFEYSKILYVEQTGSVSESFSYDPLTQKISILNPSLMAHATLFNLSGVPVCDDMYGETLNVGSLQKGIYVLKLPSGKYEKVYIY